MKTLFINRHANANSYRSAESDFDRTLSERGMKDSAEMGRRLKLRKEEIDRIVSSPAIRAITTARLIAREIGYSFENIIENQSIYRAGTHELLQVINGLQNDVENILLFGHNPGFTDIIDYLTGEQIGTLPTSGIAKIEFPEASGWNEISRHTGRLVYIDFPKNAFQI